MAILATNDFTCGNASNAYEVVVYHNQQEKNKKAAQIGAAFLSNSN
jgi:hypothetical protein